MKSGEIIPIAFTWFIPNCSPPVATVDSIVIQNVLFRALVEPSRILTVNISSIFPGRKNNVRVLGE